MFDRKKFVSNVTRHLHRRQTSPHTVSYADIRLYPTTAGFLYFLCIIGLFLLGINYQNNFVLIICCIMMAVIPFALLDTYRNLRDLQLEAMPTDRFFAGQSVRFRLHVDSDKTHYAVKITPTDEQAIEEFHDILNGGSEIGITFHPDSRGYLKSGGYAITSVYPLGIFCAHCVIDFGQQTLIYPRQLTGLYHLSEAASEKSSRVSHSSSSVKGMDELAGLRPYRQGEPLSLVAWKQLALQRGLMAKDFTATVDDNEYLDIDQITGSLEEKLSVMTYACMQLTSANMVFGLKLGSDILPPSQGAEHCTKVLEKLALYGK